MQLTYLYIHTYTYAQTYKYTYINTYILVYILTFYTYIPTGTAISYGGYVTGDHDCSG